MNNSYLLIEISNQAIFYTVRVNGEKNIIVHKSILDLPKMQSAFELFCEEVSKNVVMIMEKENFQFYNTRVYMRNKVNFDSMEMKKKLRDQLYIITGVNLTFLTEELEYFYNRNQNNYESESLIEGIAKQELRKVVLCGSFRKCLEKVREVYQYCLERNIEVLSPRNLKLEDMYNDSFALFHGEYITSERETYLIESKHTDSIEEADAIIVCNPGGYIGTRTLYEIGYADSRDKRIIFLNKEQDGFDICFPRDYGLMDFEPRGVENYG